jgi:hypothetical protein
MKKSSTLIPLLMVFYFSVSGCYANNQEKPPQKAENEERNLWDFGQVKSGEILKHDFQLKNESAKTLNILSVTTSCGCTASDAGKKVLSPGESTAIQVKFNSAGYSGKAQQYIYVQTDSLDNQVIKFIIKADVARQQVNPQ